MEGFNARGPQGGAEREDLMAGDTQETVIEICM
jgi:hypothetical protein